MNNDPLFLLRASSSLRLATCYILEIGILEIGLAEFVTYRPTITFDVSE